MNKQNKRKTSPKKSDKYLSAAERRALKKWEELKSKYNKE